MKNKMIKEKQKPQSLSYTDHAAFSQAALEKNVQNSAIWHLKSRADILNTVVYTNTCVLNWHHSSIRIVKSVAKFEIMTDVNVSMQM